MSAHRPESRRHRPVTAALLGVCGLASSMMLGLVMPPGEDDPAPDLPVESAPETSPEPTPPRPVWMQPDLPPSPIESACERLLDAETRRVAFPARETTLRDALRIASLGSGVSIDGDWAALDAIGIRPDDRLELPSMPAVLPVLLEQVLTRLSDAWDRPRIEATMEGILLTSPSGAERLTGTMLHPIGDLLHGDPLPTAVPGDPPPSEATTMADLLRIMIAPDSWAASGGRLAKVEVHREALLVTAPPSIQIAVRRLLDQLRAARPFEIDATVELVSIERETARRLEASRGAGTLAAVRAVAAEARRPPLAAADLTTPVDGTAARATCSTPTLQVELILAPTWDAARRLLRCRVSVRLDGEAVGGVRMLEVEREVGVPVGGLVLPLPAAGDQPPLVLLATLRGR